MIVLLNIKDNKAASLLEVLRGLPYVKAERISREKSIIIKEIREAVGELKLIRAGKKKARSAEEMINEL